MGAGAKGPAAGEAIESVYPQATVQTCIVHMIRHSLAHALWKERKSLAAAALDPFEAGSWGQRYSGRWCRSSPLRADPAGDLHDERDREPEQRGAACDPHAGPLPERPGGDEADPPGAARRRAEAAGAADVLARRTHRVRDPLRRALRDGGVVSSGAVFLPPCGAVRRRRAPGSVGLRPPYASYARRAKSLGARSGNPVRTFQYGRYSCRNRRTGSGFAEGWPTHVIPDTHGRNRSPRSSRPSATWSTSSTSPSASLGKALLSLTKPCPGRQSFGVHRLTHAATYPSLCHSPAPL